MQSAPNLFGEEADKGLDEQAVAGLAAIRLLQPAIITIDGPAAAGKSTIGYQLAQLINYLYFDTGIMYRAVTYAAIQRGLDLHNAELIGHLAQTIQIDITPAPPEQAHNSFVLVYVDQQEVTGHLRTPAVDRTVSIVSAYPAVREALSAQQRRIAHHYGSGKGDCLGIVMVGRDIGTVVLPDAQFKIYMEASIAERARRRYDELHDKGKQVTLAQITEELQQRDKLDSERAHSPLRPADDARLIDTSALSTDEVIHAILAAAYQTLPAPKPE
ncbi:MAG: (d)CMP kinase [Caldilineaceae bacterium]|nr:(d)CMP kinase [Caldilineaceae bacterium]